MAVLGEAHFAHPHAAEMQALATEQNQYSEK